MRESHYLLVVQWCRNDDSNTHYAKNLSWHGLYVYLDKSSGSIIVREMNTPLHDPFHPYRYVYRKIAHENDISLVADKWGVIKCHEKNKALIGLSGYSFYGDMINEHFYKTNYSKNIFFTNYNVYLCFFY